MPLYQVTVRQRKLTSGVRIEPGMSVQVVTNSYGNPVIDRKSEVNAAFLRIYGIDMNAIGALNTVYLESQPIG